MHEKRTIVRKNLSKWKWFEEGYNNAIKLIDVAASENLNVLPIYEKRVVVYKEKLEHYSQIWFFLEGIELAVINQRYYFCKPWLDVCDAVGYEIAQAQRYEVKAIDRLINEPAFAWLLDE